jgi:hypothetical protein
VWGYHPALLELECRFACWVLWLLEELARDSQSTQLTQCWCPQGLRLVLITILAAAHHMPGGMLCALTAAERIFAVSTPFLSHSLSRQGAYLGAFRQNISHWPCFTAWRLCVQAQEADRDSSSGQSTNAHAARPQLTHQPMPRVPCSRFSQWSFNVGWSMLE